MGKKNAGKGPGFPFYVMEWLTDMEEHPLDIEGAWIRICCKLYLSETCGSMTRTISQWARILRIGAEQTLAIFQYLRDHHIADVIEESKPSFEIVTEPLCHRNDQSNACVTAMSQNNNATGNAVVTVVCRRMVRDANSRKNNALRQKRYRRNARHNAEVTRPVTHPCVRAKRNIIITTTTTENLTKKESSCSNIARARNADRNAHNNANVIPQPDDTSLPCQDDRNALVLELVERWNSFARKKTTAAMEVLAVEKELSAILNGTHPDLDEHLLGLCLDNYAQALNLEHSQAQDCTLCNFLCRNYRNYLPGRYDLDNFDRSRFEYEPDDPARVYEKKQQQIKAAFAAQNKRMKNHENSQ